MLIRVLNRGLFFRRGSQVDFTGGPLGDRRVNLEGADTATHTSGDGSKGSEVLPQKAPQAVAKGTKDPDVENHPVDPDAVPSKPDNVRYDHSIIENLSHTAPGCTQPHLFGTSTENVTKGMGEVDGGGVFQTPLQQTPVLGHSEEGLLTKQRFIEHFDDILCPLETPSPDLPLDASGPASRPTAGMLSDIAEADETGGQDLSTQDLKQSPNLLRIRTLSFSSFGSSYPSSCFGSPTLNSALPCNLTTTCMATQCPEAALPVSSSAHHVSLAQSTMQLVSAEVVKPAERPSTPDSPASDFIPFIVEPLLSSKSVVRLTEDEDHVDERVLVPTTVTTSVVPSASTYADATNLALQHPEMASDILRQPLSSASASGCPSRFPTPSVSCSASLQVVPPASATCTPIRAGTPHTAERPNWALAPDVHTPSRPTSSIVPKVHTSERPNWALAKDEQKATTNRRSRSLSRGLGRSGPRPPSLVRGTDQRVLRGGKRPNADPYEPAPKAGPASAVVFPKQESECMGPLPEVPSNAADPEDGPQQWLGRVNSWVEQTSGGHKICPDIPDCDLGIACSNSLPPSSKELASQGHLRTTSGLNPRAPVWTPAPRVRCQTPTDSDSAAPATRSESSPGNSSVRGPFTFGVDTDIDRLRDMLRSCGIQDKDVNTSSIRNESTTSGSTPPVSERTEGVAPNEETQKTAVPCETREANKTCGRLDSQGVLHLQPEAPPQDFQFTTPTRFGHPFSIAEPTPGRPSSFPQNFLATPPRLAFQRANAQYFRKEPGRPWINGFFDPNAPLSGASFPQPGPVPASLAGSAPDPARLSFSQASHSFSRTCRPEPGSFHPQGCPSPFLPGSYKVRVNCVERGPDVPAPVPDAPVSPFATGMKRPRQLTMGSSTSNFKSPRFA